MTRRSWTLAGACVVVFAAGFFGTRAALPGAPVVDESCPRGPLVNWLGLDDPHAAKIAELDPKFADDLEKMRAALTESRTTLAGLFEHPDATDQAIHEQIETCIARHNELERRVADHLLRVRSHLTPDQQARLMRLCADGVRKGRGHGWGRGRGGEPCPCCGRGGRGRGRTDHGG